MMAIYFIAWVLKRIKRATSGEEENEEPERGRTLAEVQENRKRHLERQVQRKANAEDPSEALRQLFESISGETEQAAESFLPEPDPSPKPPPLKKTQATPPPLSRSSQQKTKPATPSLSPAEQKALARIKSQKTSHSKVTKTRSSRSLRSMIRGSGLRQSVVLKEILDQPRALRPY